MFCYFIDHTTCKINERELAELSLGYKNANFLSPRDGITLITCHRVEYYTHLKAKKTFIDEACDYFHETSNSHVAYRRIFEIAAGLHSKIIAEDSVLKQVGQSIQKYLYYHPQDAVLAKLLKNAKTLRDRFSFYAPNHGRLIYEHIKNEGMEKTLVLIGAGFLNQMIINSVDPSSKYTNILMFTRNVQRIKINSLNSKLPIEIAGMKYLNKKPPVGNFDVIIATDNLSEAYQKEIIELCSKNECSTISDVSSVPIPRLQDINKQYYSLYSDATKMLIEKSNLQMERKKSEIMRYIDENPDCYTTDFSI